MSVAVFDKSPNRFDSTISTAAAADAFSITPANHRSSTDRAAHQPLFAADAVTPQARSSGAMMMDTTGKKSSPGQNIVITDSIWKGLNPADAPVGVFSPAPAAGDATNDPTALYSTLCARLSQARLMRQLRAGNSPANRRMPKTQPIRRTVFLIRHAHAPINTAGNSVDVFDPCLSDLGLDQLHRMLSVFDDDPLTGPSDEDDFLATTRGLPGPSVVLCSPLLRAMETAAKTFGTTLTRDAKRAAVPIVAMEELREVVGAKVKAELRRPAAELQRMFPAVDLSLLKGNEDPFLHYAQGNGEKLAHLKERAAKVLHFLMHIEHEHDNEVPNGATIAVVSHYHLLNCLVERAICSQGRYRTVDPKTFQDTFDEASIAHQFERTQHWQQSLKNCGIVAMDMELEDCGMRAKPRWKLWAVEFTPLSI